VRAGFERGSFEIHLEIAKLYQQLVGLFSGQDATVWANLFQILGIAGVAELLGLFQLIKRDRKPPSVTIERSERVRITFEGDNPQPVEVDQPVWTLFKSLRVRKAIERVVAPLLHQGIDTFKIRHKGKDSLEAAQDEAKYFIASTEHEGETVSSSDTRVVIVAPSFQEGNRWRVSDGSRTIFVSIEDPQFVHGVQTGEEAFRKGDPLHVELQTRQWLEGKELKAEYAIVKVHHQERGQEQSKLELLRGESDPKSRNANAQREGWALSGVFQFLFVVCPLRYPDSTSLFLRRLKNPMSNPPSNNVPSSSANRITSSPTSAARMEKFHSNSIQRICTTMAIATDP
jgi:hypothetical protein